MIRYYYKTHDLVAIVLSFAMLSRSNEEKCDLFLISELTMSVTEHLKMHLLLQIVDLIEFLYFLIKFIHFLKNLAVRINFSGYDRSFAFAV